MKVNDCNLSFNNFVHRMCDAGTVELNAKFRNPLTCLFLTGVFKIVT